ncbi:uncharacterized protein K452DRAFT_316332 [Aplosporella prunicola CBS 121167]|uniref:Origin recognition complex subunit 4 n=1 Tax=Aplosporella prunicola CBS 121167 TaxID=1176127 RepID=A0A6A6BRN7_9PEZI|nr:uncharacterized protein K452DRAFT_316332 [Aplosporella prunicola CBS 121167]KAF2145251.1 hypothetical protein K452DRAFT_316332 [Aplosporella prunicola CBS 121167]
MASTRSAKRRKLSSPDEDALSPTNEAPSSTSTEVRTGGLRRPTRRNGLLSTATEQTDSPAQGKTTGSRASRSTAAVTDPYDDIDGAFAPAPRQLRSKGPAAANGTKEPDAKESGRKGSRKSAEKENQEEVLSEIAVQDMQSTARPRPKRNATEDTGKATGKAASADRTPVRVRGKRKAATTENKVKRAPATRAKTAPARASRLRRTQAAADEDHETADELAIDAPESKDASPKHKTPAKKEASATPKKPEPASLAKLVDNEDEPIVEAEEEVAQEVVAPTRRNKKAATSKQQEEDVAPQVIEQTQDLAPVEDELTLLKTIILDRITGKRPTPLVGLDDEYKKVFQLVEQTINAGEGNSMLVIGARGSGKSALVRRVLSELSKEQRQDFHIIRLNGFVHTDDKLALREIWRQLGREMEVEDDSSLGKNYADTLSTLLALLSHPSELAGQESDEVAKAVIFVMDEFDLFASHPRQTLLYNLFDIAQSRKAPITVLGLTTRIGVAESLEKRVKSRFSHRYVHLSLAKSFTAFQEICKASLSLHAEDLSVEECAKLSRSPGTGTAKGKKASQAQGADLLSQWNASITRLFADSSFVSNHLAPHYYTNKSVPAALTTLHIPLAHLTRSTPFLTASSLAPTTSTHSLHPPDSKLALLPHLTSLQHALLIAAARLDILHDAALCNFNMAYAEYCALAGAAKAASAAGGALAAGAATKVWGRGVARAEWERLVACELLVPVQAPLGGGATAAAAAAAVAPAAMVRCDVALEEIAPSVPGLERVMERWCRVL